MVRILDDKTKQDEAPVVQRPQKPHCEEQQSQLMTLANFKKMLEKRPSIAAMFNSAQKRRNSSGFNYSTNSITNASESKSAGKKSVCTIRNNDK